MLAQNAYETLAVGQFKKYIGGCDSSVQSGYELETISWNSGTCAKMTDITILSSGPFVGSRKTWGIKCTSGIEKVYDIEGLWRPKLVSQQRMPSSGEAHMAHGNLHG